MKKTHGFSLGLAGAVLMALFATMILVAMPTNVAAISVPNSEHLVYVTGSPSPNNTTEEPIERIRRRFFNRCIAYNYL